MRGLAVMIGVALALVPVATSVGQERESSWGAELAAIVKETCFLNRDNFDGIKTTALGHGWSDASRTSDASMRIVIAATEALSSQIAKTGGKLDYSVYSRAIAGQEHFFVASVVESPVAEPGVGCNFYNFNAEKEVDEAFIRSALSLDESNEKEDGGVVIHSWALSQPDGRVMSAYIHEGAPAAAQLGVTGAVVTITTVVSK